MQSILLNIRNKDSHSEIIYITYKNSVLTYNITY